MANANDTRKDSIAELQALRAAGQSQTNLARVTAKTEAELEADIAGDPAFKGMSEDWYANAIAVMPTPKKLLSLRLDTDIVDWFKHQGPGYQTRINAVLRAFVRQAGKQHG